MQGCSITVWDELMGNMMIDRFWFIWEEKESTVLTTMAIEFIDFWIYLIFFKLKFTFNCKLYCKYIRYHDSTTHDAPPWARNYSH